MRTTARKTGGVRLEIAFSLPPLGYFLVFIGCFRTLPHNLKDDSYVWSVVFANTVKKSSALGWQGGPCEAP